MKLVHHIWLTVYSKPEDNEEDILTNLNNFFPFKLSEEKLKIDRQSAQSFNERKIIIFQVHLKKTSHINKFIKNLKEILTKDQISLLLKQKLSRLDETNHFFIRFDKTKLLEKKQYHLTDTGNCFHLKFSIAAFPTTKKQAIKVIDQIFK